MRPADTFEGRALAGEQEYLDSLAQPPTRKQRGLVQTTVTLRGGITVKALVEAGQEPPVPRAELVAMLTGAARHLRGVREMTGAAYRRELVERMERAIGRERGRVAGMLLAALLLFGAAAPAHAQHVEMSSRPDATGAYTVRVTLPGQPVKVYSDHRFEYLIAVPTGHRIERVWSFIGNNAGGVMEAGIDVLSAGGFHLHQRSEHREAPGQYDAWKGEDVSWVATREDSTLRIIGISYCTGAQPVIVHWELRLLLRPVSR